MRFTHKSLAVLVSAVLIGCTMKDVPPREDFLAANMNKAVDPGVDFFEYANGGWLKKNPIPASESNWGIGKVVREQLYLNLRKTNEQAATGSHPAGSDEQKIADFWATAMDTVKAEEVGVHPLDALLARIDKIATPKDAIDAVFEMRPLSIGALYSISVDQDEKASNEMTIHLWQDGLGLPDRDYYFNTDTGVVRTRAEYVAHMSRMLRLLGRDSVSATTGAQNVLAFETALAKSSRKLEDLRDPQANYNKMTPAEVTSKLTPSINWTERLGEWKLHPANVVVGQPEFYSATEKLVATTPVPVLQDYLRLRLVESYAAYLSRAIDKEHFSFYGTVLNGQKEQRLRWKRVLDAQDGAMGMVLGRIFVKEYFPETAKKRYVNLVDAIRESYRDRINKLDWMSDATKAKALQKLAAITPKVGYPDKWKDYSALVIGRESYATNMMNAAQWAFNDMISKYGKPVDRTEWTMTPQTYNAYYNPSNNEIVLPAAIFTIMGVTDDQVDDAVVYGYAGASTIGHEITHGFDDQGRQFDAAGNLTDWWTKDDATKFEQRSQVMVKQFSAYEPLPGLHINGKASLGENIADYGGIMLGLDAFKKTEQYKSGKLIGGLTPTQRYFMGYAIGWLSQERDAALRQGLLSDVHAPAKWRVLGPMANIPEFYEAFGVKQGQPMWRAEADRVRIW
ncbi:MAG: M13 family metallopeptidase [Gemmatimonadota bacterium]